MLTLNTFRAGKFSLRDAQCELLSTLLDAANRAQASGDVRAEIRADNVLFDACLAAGMDFDEPIVRDWAAIRVAEWLVAS